MAYKVFTNGSPLPASDLNTYLMNQSVIVFADSAARSAALTAPTEGMVTYLEDDNKLYIYTGSSWVAQGSPITTQGDLIIGDAGGAASRLAIGANGTYLSSNGTTASWQTISAGGETLISTTTLTGSSVSLNSIAGTYKHLKLIIRNFRPDTDDTPIRLRFNNDSNNRYARDNALQSAGTTFADNFIALTTGTDNGTNNSLIETVIPDYANTVTWKWLTSVAAMPTAATPTSTNFYRFWGVYNQTSAISSIQLFPGTGNFTSGTALLYGVS